MNNQPIFHPVNIKHHQLKPKRACMVMSCFQIFQEDKISISTATFMNMKKFYAFIDWTVTYYEYLLSVCYVLGTYHGAVTGYLIDLR